MKYTNKTHRYKKGDVIEYEAHVPNTSGRLLTNLNGKQGIIINRKWSHTRNIPMYKVRFDNDSRSIIFEANIKWRFEDLIKENLKLQGD